MDRKIGHGNLSPNRERQTQMQPNTKGKIVLTEDLRAGQTLWLAGWTKEGDNGDKWISIVANVSDRDPQPPAAPPNYRQPQPPSYPPRYAPSPLPSQAPGYGPAPAPMTDDIPFAPQFM